jgi:two-component system, OmpR family, phosphate regulon sensor histidine kinase PhoR
MVDGRRHPSLATRLVATYAVTFLVVLGVSGLLVERTTRAALLEEIETGLLQQVAGLAELVPSDPAAVQGWVDELGPDLRARITVIDGDGTVLADSVADAGEMESHATRPEFRSALEGETGTDRRRSATTGVRQLYVAVPADGGRAVRLSLPESAVESRIGALRPRLLAIMGGAGLVGVLVVVAVARRLARPMRELADAAASVAEGDLGLDLPRSSVDELDRVATSVASMASDLGTRLTEAEAERRTLGLVLDALAQGTILVGPDEEIVYANRAVEDMLGPLPGHLSQLVPFRVQDMVRRAGAEGPVGLDVEHGRPVRILRIVATAIDGGRTLVVVGDVTERRRLNEIRRDFVANASHELKTPVASILASAETLQVALQRAPERAAQFAAQIETSATSLARLVSDLLDLSRLESGIADLSSVSLDAVVRAELQRIGGLAEQGEIALQADVAGVTVLGSEPDLGLAVRNVLDNAVRYTEPGGRVDVRVWRQEADALITVTDTGAGIPQRDLGRIFERFYRVDVARSRATGGTGLGLSIVRHVVESHGGTITVQSELGGGSTFTIRIPAD